MYIIIILAVCSLLLIRLMYFGLKYIQGKQEGLKIAIVLGHASKGLCIYRFPN